MKPTLWNDRGLLLLRAALGIVFVMHGWQKIFVFGLDGLTAFLGQAGIPFPAVNAVLLMTAEFGGGLALLAGFQTRLAGAVLAFSMAVAVLTVHLANGFFLPAGFEFALTLLLASLAVVSTGAGAYSVDAVLASRREPRTTTRLSHAA